MTEKQNEPLCQDFDEDRPIVGVPTLRLGKLNINEGEPFADVAVAVVTCAESRSEQLELSQGFPRSDDTPSGVTADNII